MRHVAIIVRLPTNTPSILHTQIIIVVVSILISNRNPRQLIDVCREGRMRYTIVPMSVGAMRVQLTINNAMVRSSVDSSIVMLVSSKMLSKPSSII